MKNTLLATLIFFSFITVNAQEKNKKNFVEIYSYSNSVSIGNAFVAVSSINKDTLFLLSNDPLSYKITEVWSFYRIKDKPIIIYVSYDRLLSEYIKQNWALKSKEERIGGSYGKCD